MDSILVTGGTGALGRVVVERLLREERTVRVASRRPPPADRSVPYQWTTVDYDSGAGLDEAVAGVHTIVHCANDFRGGVDRAVVAAARRVGTPHLVYISIVGVDRVPLGYYRRKLAAERLIQDSGLPWSILRTTQFHDLVRVMLAALARAPAMVIPAGWSFQPIDVGEVADRLVELATAPPAGRVPDLGGPEVCDMRELARSYLRAAHRRRPVLPVPVPGRVAAAYRRGGHLARDRAVGRVTFAEYLAGHPDVASVSYRSRR